MSIVTFWNNKREQTGKTVSIVALATYMAIEHNYRILVVSTSYKDNTLKNCFWTDNPIVKKNLGLFGPNTSNIAVQNGIEGLHRIVRSNKVSPDIITNYTKIIFKDRLEILDGFKGEEEEYEEVLESYSPIIELADKYYDLVLVDLDSEMPEDKKTEILERSNLIVATMSQRLSSINAFDKERETNKIFQGPKVLLLIGRYDKFSKYTAKNITRYLREKKEVSTLPYNTLFFEACEETKVPDLFLRLRKVGQDDRNGFFISEVKRLSSNILYRLQDLQMKLK